MTRMLKIEGCGQCPHASFKTSSMDDMVYVKCDHIKNDPCDFFLTKIKNVNYRIYFKCPLEEAHEEQDD